MINLKNVKLLDVVMPSAIVAVFATLIYFLWIRAGLRDPMSPIAIGALAIGFVSLKLSETLSKKLGSFIVLIATTTALFGYALVKTYQHYQSNQSYLIEVPESASLRNDIPKQVYVPSNARVREICTAYFRKNKEAPSQGGFPSVAIFVDDVVGFAKSDSDITCAIKYNKKSVYSSGEKSELGPLVAYFKLGEPKTLSFQEIDREEFEDASESHSISNYKAQGE